VFPVNRFIKLRLIHCPYAANLRSLFYCEIAFNVALIVFYTR
jgi:hypothetical protein